MRCTTMHGPHLVSVEHAHWSISLPHPPAAFDMNLLEERLKEQKRLRVEAKASHRPGQYTPVDIHSSSDSSSREDSGSATFSNSPQPTKAARGKTLPPAKKPGNKDRLTSSVEEPVKTKTKPLPPTPSKKPTSEKQGAAFLQELKKVSAKSDKPSPRPKRPKPKSSSKPEPEPPSQPSRHPPPSHTTQPTTSYEPPEYANCNFGPGQTPEDESMYMNVNAAPAPPVRRQRGGPPTQPPPLEYQNIGNAVSKHKRRH